MRRTFPSDHFVSTELSCVFLPERRDFCWVRMGRRSRVVVVVDSMWNDELCCCVVVDGSGDDE